MYFSEEISTDTIKNAGDPEVEFIGQLPQDDMTRMSMAQMAREGPTPLLSDIFIRDHVLGLQSADQMEDAINAQMAEQVLPEAQLWTLLQSSIRQGREDLAQFYQGELQKVFMMKVMEQRQMMMGQMPGQPPPQQQPPQGAMPPMGAGPTAAPQVMPDAGMGVPPPMPTQPQSPAVPPGTPRPGAQSTASRLANMGLIPPAAGG